MKKKKRKKADKVKGRKAATKASKRPREPELREVPDTRRGRVKGGEPWTREACDAILACIANRRASKESIGELTVVRDHLNEKIDEMGPSESPARLQLDHKLVVSQKKLKMERRREKWLADRVEKIALDADQGKLVDDDIAVDVSIKTLFDEVAKKAKEPKAPKEPKAKKTKRGKGTLATTDDEKPAKRNKAGKRTDDQWRFTAIGALKLAPGTHDALVKAGIGILDGIVDKVGYPSHDRASFIQVAMELLGLGDNGARELCEKLDSYLDDWDISAATADQNRESRGEGRGKEPALVPDDGGGEPEESDKE